MRYTTFNHRILNRAPIDGAVGTDFHIISDHHPSELQYLLPLTTVTRVSKTITADYGAGLNNTALAQYTVLTEPDMGMQPTAGANGRSSPDITSWTNYYPRTNMGSGLHHRLSTNRDIRRQDRQGIDYRRRTPTR